MQKQQKEGMQHNTVPSTPAAKGFRRDVILDKSTIAFQDTMMAESRHGDSFTDWFSASLATSRLRFSKVRGFNLQEFTSSIKKATYVPGESGSAGYVELESYFNRRYRAYVVGTVEQLLRILPADEIDEMAPTSLQMEGQLCYIYPQK